MTVRLLCDYPPYKAGNLFTSDANTEAGLVALHVADTNLTGGTTYVAPTMNPGSQQVSLSALQGGSGAAGVMGMTADSLDAIDVGGNAMVVTPRAFNAATGGSSWYACPSVLGATFTLTAGTSSTVLVEVLNKDGVTVATGATIVCDTVSQVLSLSMQMRDTLRYRIRQSSGTGTVSIHLEA